MHKENERLLYCFPKHTTFVDRDIEALSTCYDVQVFALNATVWWSLPFRLVAQLIWLCRQHAWQRDIICHFSGYHAVLPVLFGKRTFIILAGTDCASLPSIGYGDHSRRWMGLATRWAATHATRLLPVHRSLIERTQRYGDIRPANQGIRAFAPACTTPWTEIPYGFDTAFWMPGPATDRDHRLFVSVVGPAAPNNRVHTLKGVDLLIETAQRLPDARFKIIGLSDPDAYADVPPNVRFIGRLAPSELRAEYQCSAYYIQWSLSEGMPNALCEAMSCGCIPLVSDVSSMPFIVEGIGKVLERKDAGLAAERCRELLTLPPEEADRASRAARERIIRDFQRQRRINALLDILGYHER